MTEAIHTAYLFLTALGLGYVLLFPLVMGGYLTSRIDPDLFNGSYWAGVETIFPFYRWRRAGLYALGASARWIARRRFGGYDFASRLSPGARFACRLFALSLVFVTVSLASLAFFGERR